MIRMVLLEQTERTILEQLSRDDGKEQGAFCFVTEGKGIRGTRLLVTDTLTPPPDAWEIQSAGQLRPSAKWISAAVSRAIEAKMGLLFVHSHPDAAFPASFSCADISGFTSLASTLAPMLDGRFAAAVVHPAGWQGYVWSGASIVQVDRIASVGEGLRILSPLHRVERSALDARQEDALGVVHHIVRSLTVAVVGAGGLGSPIAEQLVRVGVAEVIIIDHDLLDTDSNVRRVFGARMKDLRRRRPKSKAEVVGKYLDELGLGVGVRTVTGDVRTERGFRELLDADIVICATDTHGSRAVINDLASAYLLPVIDVGVRVGQRSNAQLSGLLAEIRLLTPTRPCLWCRGSISADVVRAENLPRKERERLVHEGYVVNGVGAPEPSVVALTVLGSGLATSALLGLLSDEADVVPPGYWVDGLLGDSGIAHSLQTKHGCRCQSILGKGDAAAPPFIG